MPPYMPEFGQGYHKPVLSHRLIDGLDRHGKRKSVNSNVARQFRLHLMTSSGAVFVKFLSASNSLIQPGADAPCAFVDYGPPKSSMRSVQQCKSEGRGQGKRQSQSQSSIQPHTPGQHQAQTDPSGHIISCTCLCPGCQASQPYATSEFSQLSALEDLSLNHVVA